MSQENVEAVRRAFEAFNRGDRDAAVADFAPDMRVRRQRRDPRRHRDLSGA